MSNNMFFDKGYFSDTTPLEITYNGGRIRANIVKGNSLADALKEIIKTHEELEKGRFEEIDNIDD